MSKARILLVNDDVFQLSLIANFLEKEGWDVVSCSQTEKALEEIEKASPPFDLIITDLHMPVIDGWRFCRLLRSEEFKNYNNTPLLVVSATFSGVDAESITRDIGANAFLPIPFKTEDLRNAVVNLLQGKVHSVKKRVLVIEDSKSQRLVIKRTFDKAGFEVYEASTGREGVSLFHKVGPDIVILDYHLPDITGDKLISKFKKPPSLASVILITVEPSTKLAVKILRLGADAYVRKPFEPEYLVDLAYKTQRERALLRIEDLLEKRTRELRESKESFQTVADFTFNWEFWLNPDGSFAYCSPSCERITGYTKEEFLEGKISFIDLAHPDDRKLMQSFYSNALGGGSGQELPCKIRDKEGQTHWVAITWRPIVRENGMFNGVRGSVHDITGRQKVERQQNIFHNLAYSLSSIHSLDKALSLCLRAAVKGVEVDYGALFMIDKNNRALCRYEFGGPFDSSCSGEAFELGTKFLTILEKKQSVLLPPINMDRGLVNFLSEREVTLDAILPVKVDGKLRVFLVFASRKPKFIGMLEVRFLEILSDQIANTISRSELEEALRRSEAKFRSLFEFAGDAILILKDEVFVECNAKASEMFGSPRESILGKTLLDFSPDIQPSGEASSKLIADKISRALAGEPQFYFWQHKKPGGEIFDAEISLNRIELGDEIYLQAIIRDITERKRLEAQLQHAQKMEAIGTLAGGIAHDFNNILGGIMGYIDLLKMEMPPGSRQRKILMTIENAGKRAIELTKQLLMFSRKDEIETRCFDINRSIKNVSTLLKRTLDKKIEIVLELEDNIPGVVGDPGQLEQMIMNLCVNASDAMPNGGVLKIKTGFVDLDRLDKDTKVGRYFRGADLQEKEYVVLEISDTGCGMDEQTKRRIFEPFFTTKDVGKGTGLGLAMVYGIVKNHKGNIHVESKLGEGTVFTICLPAGGKVEVEEEIDLAEPAKGTGTILVVDDEEIIRNMLTEILQKLGYRILLACDGKEGVDVFEKNCQDIDLVILDMNMPIMDGRETFKKIKEIDPDVRALLTTGFSMTKGTQDILDEGFVGYITKPFTINQLSEKIREIMGDKRVREDPASVQAVENIMN